MATLIRTLFALGSRLPLLVLHALGSALGWLSFLLSPTYRQRLLSNARQAGQPRAVALRSVGQAGRLVTELPRLWLGAPVSLRWQGASASRPRRRPGAACCFSRRTLVASKSQPKPTRRVSGPRGP